MFEDSNVYFFLFLYYWFRIDCEEDNEIGTNEKRYCRVIQGIV